MVAALKDTRQPLPLLLEPMKPEKANPKGWGWRPRYVRKGREIVRQDERIYSHDQHGALAQHIVVRYLVHGVQRCQLAQETGYSERQIQTYIQARAWEAYTVPVLRTLTDLGISPRRGQRDAVRSRTSEIVRAYEQLLARVDGLLWANHSPDAEAFRETLRLLLAGREPLTP